MRETGAKFGIEERVDRSHAPPVAGFRLLHWSAIDALAEIGYRHAHERLEHWERTGVSRRYRIGV